MNQNERSLFKLCKIGDLQAVKVLIDNEDVDLNLRDKWDSTPLYYACLCGHIDLVEFLLENGARCEANTFDSERCQYGALTDQIRNVLRNFKVNKTKLDQYELFLERLLEVGSHYDIVFDIKGKLFKAHKCILASRSEYFRLKFENKWKQRKFINGSHEQLIPEAFSSILKYIYTGRFVCQTNQLRHCLRLAKLFKLKSLIEEFDKRYYTSMQLQMNLEVEHKPKTNVNELTVKDTEIFLMGKFGTNSKISNTISIEPNDIRIADETGLKFTNEINEDFKLLIEACMPHNTSHLKAIADLTHDLCFNLDDFKLYAHKAFVVERCDYFKTFLNDPFNEIEAKPDDSKQTTIIPQLNLKEIDKEVFTEIIYFIYSDSFSKDKLDENVLYEVLIAADLYLLPSLKRKCANELINSLNKENLFDFLRVSRVYDLKKLEFACVSYLALNIFEFETSQELREIILEDASKLKKRQETDSIDIIDDLRYAINDPSLSTSTLINFKASKTNNSNVLNKHNETTGNFVSSFEFLVEKEKKLNVIDQILRELNLEC